MDTLLNTQSGLLGVSGLTNDMRELHAELNEHDDRRVRLAIEIFCYRARKYVGAYLAAMAGADAIVFTGGIGETWPMFERESVLGWSGPVFIATQRRIATCRSRKRISTDDSKLLAYVIPTDEELLIARDTLRVVLGVPHPS